MTRSKWMTRGAIAAGFVGVLALGAYATVDGQGRGRGAGPMGGRPMGPGMMGAGRFGGPLAGLRGLDLTEQQRTQVQQLLEQHREQTKDVAERAMAARKAVRDAIEADTVDEGAIRARTADAAAIEADLAIAQAHLRQSILQLLTPEQRQKAKEVRGRVEQRLEQWMENRQSRLERRHDRLQNRLDRLRGDR